ncbi:MAG: four helix bundle protein [Chloroflexi bacterium]|nr:four helix bundle protein [Chloroflexota bacterium]
MRDFRKLLVWQEGPALTLIVYRRTQQFRREEPFGLTSRMRRAASSIPSSIAEGCGRDSQAELIGLCTIAARSASELDYQLELAHDFNLIDQTIDREVAEEVTQCRKMLYSFAEKLKADARPQVGRLSRSQRRQKRPES